jgi:hypothetical protein
MNARELQADYDRVWHGFRKLFPLR